MMSESHPLIFGELSVMKQEMSPLNVPAEGDQDPLLFNAESIFIKIEEGPLSTDLSTGESSSENNDGSPTSPLSEFTCFHCGYRTEGLRSLRSHIIYKHSEIFCPKNRLCVTERLEDAMIDKGGSSELRHICKTVHESYVTEKNTEERYYFCSHCEYKSKRLNNLKTHVIAIHTDERPYSCPHCDYKSTQSGHLKRHIMFKHSFERPYSCPHCPYKSAVSESLRTHIMHKHTDDRPFSCPHCEHKSILLMHLKNHIMAKHTDHRPFACPRCEYKTTRSGDLKRHVMIKHSSERPYSCPCCEYKTILPSRLRKHISKHSQVFAVPKPISTINPSSEPNT